MPVRFSQVAGSIYRGGEPSPKDLDILKNVYNIKTILTLDQTIGAKIHPYVEKLGMKHIIIPIAGSGSKDKIKYLKNYIGTLLESNQPIYVHCKHGSDRTGMAIAFYRISRQGWKPEVALAEAKKFNFGSLLDPITAKLYTNSILGSDETDTNTVTDSDITSTMRDQFDMGRTPPAFLPQQSFAPREDTKYDEPDYLTDSPVYDDQVLRTLNDPVGLGNPRPKSNERRSALRQLALEMLLHEGEGGVPQVGGRDGGDIPMGVGPVETGGGFLNL